MDLHDNSNIAVLPINYENTQLFLKTIRDIQFRTKNTKAIMSVKSFQKFLIEVGFTSTESEEESPLMQAVKWFKEQTKLDLKFNDIIYRDFSLKDESKDNYYRRVPEDFILIY